MMAQRIAIRPYIILLLFLAACSPAVSIPKTGNPTATTPKTGSPTVTTAPVAKAATAVPATSRPSDISACAYVPGQSTAVQAPAQPATLEPTPSATAFTLVQSQVDADTTAAQLKEYQLIWSDVKQDYVYSDFGGKDWQAIGNRYEQAIRQGMSQETFYAAMKQMLFELDGGISSFLTPAENQQMQQSNTGALAFVGIGGFFTRFDTPTTHIALTGVLPGSPAEQAGLQPHDMILAVDGGPVFDDQGLPRTLGSEGSRVTLQVQTPGQPPREIKLTRRKMSGSLPLQYCLVTGTQVGYIHLISYSDPNLIRDLTAALKKLDASGQLKGLVLDVRGTGGGATDAVGNVLSFFTKGDQGSFIARNHTYSYSANPPFDVGGSQTVPLVVVQDPTGGPIEQLLSGVLQLQGRAKIVGLPITEPLYVLNPFDLQGGALLLIATQTFQPKGKPARYFDQNGIQPDVLIPLRWDQYTAATDPMLAKAVELLTKR